MAGGIRRNFRLRAPLAPSAKVRKLWTIGSLSRKKTQLLHPTDRREYSHAPVPILKLWNKGPLSGLLLLGPSTMSVFGYVAYDAGTYTVRIDYIRNTWSTSGSPGFGRSSWGRKAVLPGAVARVGFQTSCPSPSSYKYENTYSSGRKYIQIHIYIYTINIL